MGNSLHYAKKYEIEYDNVSMFSFGCEEISYILDDFNCDILGNSDIDPGACFCGLEFDVERTQIENLVKELKNTTKREMYNIPVDDLIYFFDSALKNADKKSEYIHFSWF